jgi:excisionase family DNA binding protein
MQRDQEEPQPQLLLTIRQVQKTLKLSRSMVYLLIKRGELRAIHIGKAVRVKQSEIRRFVQTREAVEQTERVANKKRNTKKREQGGKSYGFPS